jgi:hypothetical protein
MNSSLKRFNEFITENEDRLGRLADLGLTSDLVRLKHRVAKLVQESGESSIWISQDDLLTSAQSSFDYDYDLANWFSTTFDEDVLSTGSQADAIEMLGQESLIDNEDGQMTDYEYEAACRQQMEYNWEQIYAQLRLEILRSGEIAVHGEFFERSGPAREFNELVPPRGFSLERLGASELDMEQIYSDVIYIIEKNS